MIRRGQIVVLTAFFLLAYAACGNSETSPSAEPQAEAQSASSPEPGSEPGVEGEVEGAAVADDDVEEINADDLVEAGQMVLKQYSVAYIGSGTMGEGFLTVNGETHAFRIGGLGIGGIGVAAIDASGVVYNLPSVDAFAGTYGNARLGMTGGSKGKGRVWLKNTNGVVMELTTQMRGLALTGGVDGVLVTWEDDYQDSIAGNIADGTVDVLQGATKGTATVVDGAAEGTKNVFKAVAKPFN